MLTNKKRITVVAGVSAALLGVTAMLPTDVGGPASVEAYSAYTPYDVYAYMGAALIGDSVEAKHPRWIEGASFDWGGKTPTVYTSTGAGVGKFTPEDVILVKAVDRATPGLFSTMAAGTNLATVTVDVVVNGDVGGYTRFTLKNARITSIHTAARRADAYSQANTGERVTMSYGSIKIEQWAPKVDGALTLVSCSGWNVATATRLVC